MSAKWIDTAEQAKMIRADLKAAFPATKFSVRISRYSMGSSVSVKWMDGPTVADVTKVTGYYEARGMVDQSDYWPHRIVTLSNGDVVSFSGSVSESREYSLEFYQEQMDKVSRTFGVERIVVKRNKWGGLEAPGASSVRIGDRSDLQYETWRMLQETRGPGVKVGTVVRPMIAAVREV